MINSTSNPGVLLLLLAASFSTVESFLNTAQISSNLQLHTHTTICQESHRSIASFQAINGDRASSDEMTNYNYIGLNTNKGAPYVPSGLSPEQYQKIKQDEAAKAAKMNFGAWGPRFRPADTPDGDWMVQTNLWVKGFQYGGSSSSSLASSPEEMERQETRKQQVGTAKTALASFLLAYAVLDMVLLSFESIRSGSTTKHLLASLVARQGIFQALKQHLVSSVLIGKAQCFKLALAGLAAPLVSKYRETANRRWLWTTRRTVGTPLVAAVLLVSVKMALGMGVQAVVMR